MKFLFLSLTHLSKTNQAISDMRLFSILLLFTVFSVTLTAQKSKEPKVVSGTVLVNDKLPLDTKLLLNALKNDWKVKADSVSTADKTLIFSAQGATVMIAQLEYPIDPIEIRAAAKLSWIWPNGTEEALKHQSQLVISVVGNEDKALDLYKLFTKVAGALLESTHSAGVYMGSEFLLLQKGFYLSAARNLRDSQSLPIYCWVYFGRPGDGGGYTFGMQEFGLKELEIVQSSHSEADVHSTLYDVASSIIKYNTRLHDGESAITEEGQKILVKQAKGSLLQGQDVFVLQY